MLNSNILMLMHPENRALVDVLFRKMTDTTRFNIFLGEQDIDSLSLLDYDVVLLDAVLIQNSSKSINKLLTYNPNLKIIVISSSPNWMWARNVLYAGVIAYIPLNLKGNKFIDAITEALNQALKN